MTNAQKLGVASVVAALLGAAAGVWIMDRRGASDVAAARAESDAARAAAADLGRELEAAVAERDSLRREVASVRREQDRLREPEVRPVENAASAAGEPTPAAPDAKARTEAVDRLVAAARAAIEREDGRSALAATRELAGVIPEGRSPAMTLVAELESRDRLGVGDVEWGGFLASPAVTDLLGWSLGRPSPEAFREIAAEVLPTLVPEETAVPRFREALLTETDEDVQRSMVEGLTGMSGPGADLALSELFADSRVAVPVRVQIATHLSQSDLPEGREALRAALGTAPAVLAAGIRAALSAHEATESGFLVTGFVNGTERNGPLEVGDLLLTYDGRDAAEELHAAVKRALDRDGPIQVEALRSGARQTLEVRPGWLGLIGCVVRGRSGGR